MDVSSVSATVCTGGETGLVFASVAGWVVSVLVDLSRNFLLWLEKRFKKGDMLSGSLKQRLLAGL